MAFFFSSSVILFFLSHFLFFFLVLWIYYPTMQISAKKSAKSLMKLSLYCCCSVLIMLDSLPPHGLQLAKLPALHYPLSLLKLMSIESVMPSNHLILCCPLLLFSQISQHQDIFQRVSSSHQVAKVLELLHQSFQWIFRVDFL